MSIKEKMLRFKEVFERTFKSETSKKQKEIAESISSLIYEAATSKREKTVTLNDKIEQFIKWYDDNMVKGPYTDIGEYHLVIKMRNFIEKMAVWYELRYPDYEVNRLMTGSAQEEKEVSKIMFQQNPYINELFDENADICCLDWDEFYNAKTFIDSLPWEERCYFLRPNYPNIVYWNPSKNSSIHLNLSKNGYIKISEFMECVIPSISNKELEEKHIKEVVKMLKENNVAFPEHNEFETAINNYEKSLYCKEEMLNCVMYRIIERGGKRIGPRRAFLFAKEFKRNIDIPMIYGIDYSDPGLRKFINEYIKAGGSKNLVCYVGYFSRYHENENIDTITIEELLKKQPNNAATFYTPEEDELHQRLVNVLFSQVNLDEVRKEEIKKLRLERKLRKSKNAKKFKD